MFRYQDRPEISDRLDVPPQREVQDIGVWEKYNYISVFAVQDGSPVRGPKPKSVMIDKGLKTGVSSEKRKAL